MAAHKFFEIIKQGTNFEFVGKQRTSITISLLAVLGSLAMLPLNAFVFKGRGSMLNWGVDFRGGSELLVRFSKEVEPGDVRQAMEAAGFQGAEVVRYGQASEAGRSYMLRIGAVSVLSEDQAKKLEGALGTVGDAKLKSLEWSEGGDKVYLRFDKTLESSRVREALTAAGTETTQVQPFGRADDNTFEATLIGLDVEVRKGLEAKLGVGAVAEIPQVESVGAKAGRQLQYDGVQAVFGAILLIVLYVALRFDFRFGPGTIIALLHDAIVTVGAFAVTYKEFSLTTLAAVLTIIGYSVNDTIVVFDRVRENAVRFKDRAFDRVVNQSVNETLSRTILTSATLLFVTLAMNVLGSGVVKDFAFAMNVGVIVGTYSTIFIASPALIWLDNRFRAAAKKGAAAPRRGRRRTAESASSV
ncbi:MAG: protein translocase subunit SecF [Myxococcales bacterium]|nr:protein translocase subunit SecF [Myxococcales bacterium]